MGGSEEGGGDIYSGGEGGRLDHGCMNLPPTFLLEIVIEKGRGPGTYDDVSRKGRGGIEDWDRWMMDVSFEQSLLISRRLAIGVKRHSSILNIFVMDNVNVKF